jgi:hypothetical protein
VPGMATESMKTLTPGALVALPLIAGTAPA